MERTTLMITKILDELHAKEGIAYGRMILGGFSMGGGMALRIGLMRPSKEQQLGGVICLSSFLSSASQVWSHLAHLQEPAAAMPATACTTPSTEAVGGAAAAGEGERAGGGGLLASIPPVLMYHGSHDPMVSPMWGKTTAERLQTQGKLPSCEFHLAQGVQHDLGDEEMQSVTRWIMQRMTSLLK